MVAWRPCAISRCARCRGGSAISANCASDALNRLCGFEACLDTPVQRHNHQQYKATLHAMINLQVRELALAEATLQRIGEQLRVAMRSERVLRDALNGKWQEWQALLARQEQRLQDGLGAQVWWRNRLAGSA